MIVTLVLVAIAAVGVLIALFLCLAVILAKLNQFLDKNP